MRKREIVYSTGRHISFDAIIYAAGFFDADGSVSIIAQNGGVRFRLRVNITNTDPRVLSWLLKVFGGRIGWEKSKVVTWKDKGRWHLSGPRAAEFLRITRPWLIVKAERADIGMAFQRTLKYRSKLSSIKGKQGFQKGARVPLIVLEERKQLSDRLYRLNGLPSVKIV